MAEIAAVIKVENLEKSYKVGNQLIPVIKGMSFEVNKGDFTVIIGPSGSGKSTLLHMLLGLEVPSVGSVSCLGVSLYDLPNEDARSSFRKKHVGMVYQQPNWVKSLSVIENVAFPLSLLGVEKGEAIKKAWHSILNMNMSNWVNYFPTELSGGQQQKVALARALVTDPEIIIADEPTGNLDFESGKNLMQLLSDLNASGKTVLMVTHDLEYIKYAKRVVKIFDGKVESVVVGDQKTILEQAVPTKRGESLIIETVPEANKVAAVVVPSPPESVIDVKKEVSPEVPQELPVTEQAVASVEAPKIVSTEVPTIKVNPVVPKRPARFFSKKANN